jgi:uncharacterized protein
MLMVDLGQLQRKGRIRIDETVPAADPLLKQVEAELPAGLGVALEATPTGADVLVRGRLNGTVRLACRRCLREIEQPLEEEVTWLFRAGLSPAEAETEGVYALPAKAREIDLAPAVREQILLAVPLYPLCSESCRGLCPRCGADLNQGPCSCGEEAMDPRWAGIRQRTQ